MLEQLPDAIGEALSDVRSGLTNTLQHRVVLRQGMTAIELRSSAFADHFTPPRRCSADGGGLSPPLRWRGMPAGARARALVLIVEDADSRTPHALVHANALGLRSEPAPTPDSLQGPGEPLPQTPGCDALARP